MSGTERRVSATEVWVRFGELLDVTARHDVVFVERAGKEVAVEEAIRAGRDDRDKERYGRVC
jgi:hypothetical protein